MDLIKYRKGEVLFHLRHNLRQLPKEKEPSNESIDHTLTYRNWRLMDRGKTAEEVNDYQKDLMKKIFKYNRKNAVYAVEIVLQCPSDCPQERERDFFQESYYYFASQLPMGEECVLQAEIHCDERHYAPDGRMISKDHLHFIFVPAVPDDKHDEFEYKLCADQLTRRARMRQLHPGLQEALKKAGIPGTVYRKKEGTGRTIAFSVKQLKELTEKTGIQIDHTLTTDDLAQLMNQNALQKEKILGLEKKLSEMEADPKQAEMLQSVIQSLKEENLKIRGLYDQKVLELQQEKQRAIGLENRIGNLEKIQTQETPWGQTKNWGQTHGWESAQRTEQEQQFEEKEI